MSDLALALMRPHFVTLGDVAYVPAEAAALALGQSVKTFRRHAKRHSVEPTIYRRVLLWRVEEILTLADRKADPNV